MQIIIIFMQWKQNEISIYINFYIQCIFKLEDSRTQSNWNNMDRGNSLSWFFLFNIIRFLRQRKQNKHLCTVLFYWNQIIFRKGAVG